MSSEVAKKLEEVVVTRYSDKAQVRLGDLWKEQGVLLCMFRRWGCAMCRISAVNISGLHDILDQNNIALVGIGVEELGIDEFMEEQFFSGVLHVDYERRAYKALSCNINTWRNLWGLLDGALDFLKVAEGKGYKNNLKGDIGQLGGTFLIAKGGQSLYEHMQTSTSFEPDLKKIVEALGVEFPADFEFYPTYAARLARTQARRAAQ
jgi:prostamide/prostaglandin F2alpha synthase